MPTKNSPIRMDKVEEALKFIKDRGLENATSHQKLFFLFLKRNHINLGLSIMEIALIIHEDERETVTITDKKTGEVSQITRPTREAWQKTHQEVKTFREYCWEKGGIVFFCGTVLATGAQLYYNMTKHQYLKLVMQQLDRIARGAKGTKNKIIDWLKLPAELKRQLTRTAERRVHQEVMELMLKEQMKTNKKKRKINPQELEESYVQ